MTSPTCQFSTLMASVKHCGLSGLRQSPIMELLSDTTVTAWDHHDAEVIEKNWTRRAMGVLQHYPHGAPLDTRDET